MLFGNMNCIEFKKLISSYLEGPLEKNLLDEFADHLVTCETCENEVLNEAEKHLTKGDRKYIN